MRVSRGCLGSWGQRWSSGHALVNVCCWHQERSVSTLVRPRYLVAMILEHGGPFQAVVRQNPSVQKALALIREDCDRFAPRSSPYEWALLHGLDRSQAARVAATLNASDFLRLKHELQFATGQYNGSTLLEQYWLLKIQGEEARATELYREAVRNGIPLPPL